MRGRRVFDWRFVLAFAFMMLAVVASWGFVQRQQQIDGLIEVSQRTTAQVDRLSDQVEAQKRQAAEDARAARARQQSLRQAIRRQNQQMQVLIDALTAHGIPVPDLKVAPSSSGGGSSHPKGGGPRGPSQQHPSHHPAQGSPAPTPALTAPNADLICDFLPVACLL